MVEAFDPLDVYELLDAMEWWGQEPSPAVPNRRICMDNKTRGASTVPNAEQS